MSKYLFTGKTSCVDEEKVKVYLQGSKYVEIKDKELLSMTIKQIFSDITCVLGSLDRDIVEIIKSSKIKKNLHVITDSIVVAKELRESVAGIIVLDKYTKNMPSLWNTSIVTLDNVLSLRQSGLPTVSFKSASTRLENIQYLKIINDDNGYRAEFKSVDSRQSLKDFKQELQKLKKEASIIVKKAKIGKKIELKDNLALAKKGTQLSEINDMKDYLLSRGFVTQSQLDTLDSTNGVLELEVANKGIISFEDLTEIVRYYYNLEMLGKEDLRGYTTKFNKVSEIMRDKGVAEVYDVEDYQYENTFVIIPYDRRDVLLHEINSTINYKKAYFAVPAYTKGLIDSVKLT